MEFLRKTANKLARDEYRSLAVYKWIKLISADLPELDKTAKAKLDLC